MHSACQAGQSHGLIDDARYDDNTGHMPHRALACSVLDDGVRPTLSDQTHTEHAVTVPACDPVRPDEPYAARRHAVAVPPEGGYGALTPRLADEHPGGGTRTSLLFLLDLPTVERRTN